MIVFRKIIAAWILTVFCYSCHNKQPVESKIVDSVALIENKLDTIQQSQAPFSSIDSGFAGNLKLESFKRFGLLWGSELERWAFEMNNPSAVTDELWQHILPKSTTDDNQIIITKRELAHILKMDNIKMLGRSPEAVSDSLLLHTHQSTWTNQSKHL